MHNKSRLSSGGDAGADYGGIATAAALESREDRHHHRRIQALITQKLAQGMGMYAEGPVFRSERTLGRAIRRALDVVKNEESRRWWDVHTQAALRGG